MILDVEVIQHNISTYLILDIEFGGKYSKVRFHPFAKQIQLAESFLHRIIKYHREYMDRTIKLSENGTKNIK